MIEEQVIVGAEGPVGSAENVGVSGSGDTPETQRQRRPLRPRSFNLRAFPVHRAVVGPVDRVHAQVQLLCVQRDRVHLNTVLSLIDVVHRCTEAPVRRPLHVEHQMLILPTRRQRPIPVARDLRLIRGGRRRGLRVEQRGEKGKDDYRKNTLVRGMTDHARRLSRINMLVMG